MNLGHQQSGSALRRGWPRQASAMGLAVVVGVFGFAGVHRTEGRADAAAAAVAVDWPAAPAPEPVVDLPVPPRVLMTPEEEPAAAATPPEESTTTTTAAPPVATTTTVPPPPAPPITAPPTPAPPKAAPTPRQAQTEVEAIADSSGWNWRAGGVRINLGYYPADCCHWGVYEAAKSTIWVGPSAFGDPVRLRYVVLHELAHAWQYRQNRFAQFIEDYAPWGFTTIGPALEAGADCVAAVWGAGGGHYWQCPSDAQALAARRLRGDWR